ELVKESVLVGTAGAALGIPLGIGLGRLILPVIATTTALTYRLAAPDARLTLSTPSLALAALLGVGTALLAAVLPAWRATALGVRATLLGRGVEQPGAGLRALWLSRALTLAAVGAAIALESATGSAAWGLLASALIAVATALAARPLLHLL